MNRTRETNLTYQIQNTKNEDLEFVCHLLTRELTIKKIKVIQPGMDIIKMYRKHRQKEY
jgi:hypothetical protein